MRVSVVGRSKEAEGAASRESDQSVWGFVCVHVPLTVQYLLYQMPLQHLEAAPIVCEGCKWGIGVGWYILQRIIQINAMPPLSHG